MFVAQKVVALFFCVTCVHISSGADESKCCVGSCGFCMYKERRVDQGAGGAI